MIVNFTGSKEAEETALPLVASNFGPFGSPRPRNKEGEAKEAFIALSGGMKESEVFLPLEIGFCSLSP
ncbi:hypothetical protein MASR2M78_16850 [Treponema sp.]